MAKTDDGIDRYRGKALGGKAPKGTDFEPGEQPASSAPGAAVPEFDRPRPAKTRYPIPYEVFIKLKQRASIARPPVKRHATEASDKGRKKREVATAAVLIAAPITEAPSAAPTSVGNFAGIAMTAFVPPDCTLAAGQQHVLVSVNSTVAIYAKTGGAPLLQRTLTSWFSNVISEAKIFDPKAVFDQHAGRWVLVAVALGTTSNTSFFLLSVSKTGDPLGGWFNYKLNAKKDGTTSTNNWADYPSLGVDKDALYITANMFRFGGNFQYAKIRIVPKTGPYSGGTASFKDLVKMKNADGSMAFTVQPCHTYNAPAAQYLVNSISPNASSPTQSKLSLWSLTNPLTTPTLTRRTVVTAPYSFPPDAGQKGGGVSIDTGDNRVLNAVFRGGSVWCAFVTGQDWGDGTNVAACHWFQINATSGELTQQGIYGAKRFHYFYPVVMPDTNGNVTMVFARSGSSKFASIFYTGRKSTDPLGALQPSELLKAGVANYVQLDGFGRNRWGDYNGIASDPANGRIVWIYSQFASAVNTWSTWVGQSAF